MTIKKGQFNSSLFHCDFGLCCKAIICPCLVVNSTQARLDKSKNGLRTGTVALGELSGRYNWIWMQPLSKFVTFTPMMVNNIMPTINAIGSILTSIMLFKQRKEIKEKYGIPMASPAVEFLTVWFCSLCVIVQHELQTRPPKTIVQPIAAQPM
ncbi:Oidioi.mRNA.OKI2018_I69.chr1.g32.t1.cds [Oikopleura dioica]|uniref:Oidioi.mRNA.OKI2018_I69.chr1.g32.t1.cds n=1 Tax=Oikopleura dioica TaxID=34765 RepID=A0ABN7SMB9_OIKDI|nr:Oidioi.mRNA.OKI2018_I69.chr1.g32.t1.cds [Oikopleura dioica]